MIHLKVLRVHSQEMKKQLGKEIPTMRLKVNGETREYSREEYSDVAALLDLQNAPPGGIAVALNGRVVPRADWKNAPLNDGDEIEIIRAVQGG